MAEQAAQRLLLIAGLGNPGVRYRDTRHNVGRRFLELLAQRHHAEFRARSGLPGELAQVQLEDTACRLFRPSTFMNESGRALGSVLRALRMKVEQVLVLHDDIDLPPGIVRLKRCGGHGGHNGLRDILARVGSDFPRLRFGVGRPAAKEDVIDYVLQRPQPAEAVLIVEALEAALELLPLMVRGDLESVMQRLHSRPLPPSLSQEN